MAVQGYVAVRLCSARDLVSILEAAECGVSEATRPTPELDALLARLKATVNAATANDLGAVYLVGGAEW